MPDGEKRAVGAPVVLVSASPRRHELLARLLPVFELAHSLVEERQPRDLPDRDLPPLPLPPPFRVLHKVDPRLWAWRKALDYLSHVSYPAAEVVLSADTAVAARTELLGKPQDHDDAMRMLRLLSGESHYVITGYCIISEGSQYPTAEAIGVVITEVVMREASDAELEAYITTGEPFDKAGAYALQGLGGKLIKEVRGCWSTVVGLPLCAVRLELEALGVSLLARPDDGYCTFCR